MPGPSVVDLRPGAPVWLDGRRWVVQALQGPQVVLQDGPRVQVMSLLDVASRAQPLTSEV